MTAISDLNGTFLVRTGEMWIVEVLSCVNLNLTSDPSPNLSHYPICSRIWKRNSVKTLMLTEDGEEQHKEKRHNGKNNNNNNKNRWVVILPAGEGPAVPANGLATLGQDSSYLLPSAWRIFEFKVDLAPGSRRIPLIPLKEVCKQKSLSY